MVGILEFFAVHSSRFIYCSLARPRSPETMKKVNRTAPVKVEYIRRTDVTQRCHCQVLLAETNANQPRYKS